jgi:hypothetical protein
MDLDKWLQEVKQCKFLSETSMKELCKLVSPLSFVMNCIGGRITPRRSWCATCK